MTALVVIDELRIGRRVRDQLQDRGMEVTLARTVAEATTAARAGTFLVAILDLSLSDGSGLDVLRVFRDSGSPVHVIMLGGPTSELERVDVLHRGADDFVAKPFFLRELTARVLAVRRRHQPEPDTRIRIGRCEIDLGRRQVTADGRPVHLTAKEFDLLAYLAVRPGHVFTREQLLQAVWRSTPEWQQRATVTEHVRRLRTKIEPEPGRPTILVTVRGTGYRLDLPTGDEAPRALAAPTPGVGVLVHVDGRIVFADRAAGDLLAVEDTGSLEGRHVLELVAPRSQEAATARLAAGAGGPPRRSEIMQLCRADGAPVTVEVATSGVDWHGTSARRVQLTTLADGPNRLRQLITGVLEDVADAVIVTDLSFHIRSWNTSAERIYGWSEDAVLGRHVLDIVQWVGDGGQLAESWEQLERTGRWTGQGLQLAHDGSTVHVHSSTTLLGADSGQPYGVVSVNRLVALADAPRTPSAHAVPDPVERDVDRVAPMVRWLVQRAERSGSSVSDPSQRWSAGAAPIGGPAYRRDPGVGRGAAGTSSPSPSACSSKPAARSRDGGVPGPSPCSR